LEKEPKTYDQLMIRVKYSGGDWQKVSRIRPFSPLPIQHREDEGTPESYVTEDGTEVSTNAPFIESKYERTRGGDS